MENLFSQLSPMQIFYAFALNAWIFIIFPVLVIRKLNYLTQLVESQFDPGDADNASEN